MAVDQLRNSLDVIAESVNALRVTRDGWREAARRADDVLVEVEVVCSDRHEERDRLVVDTADVGVPGSVRLMEQAVRDRFANRGAEWRGSPA